MKAKVLAMVKQGEHRTILIGGAARFRVDSSPDPEAGRIIRVQLKTDEGWVPIFHRSAAPNFEAFEDTPGSLEVTPALQDPRHQEFLFPPKKA